MRTYNFDSEVIVNIKIISEYFITHRWYTPIKNREDSTKPLKDLFDDHYDIQLAYLLCKIHFGWNEYHITQESLVKCVKMMIDQILGDLQKFLNLKPKVNHNAISAISTVCRCSEEVSAFVIALVRVCNHRWRPDYIYLNSIGGMDISKILDPVELEVIQLSIMSKSIDRVHMVLNTAFEIERYLSKSDDEKLNWEYLLDVSKSSWFYLVGWGRTFYLNNLHLISK